MIGSAIAEALADKSGITLSSEVMKIFQEYYWPGNVREIRNEVERRCRVWACTSIGTIRSRSSIAVTWALRII